MKSQKVVQRVKELVGKSLTHEPNWFSIRLNQEGEEPDANLIKRVMEKLDEVGFSEKIFDWIRCDYWYYDFDSNTIAEPQGDVLLSTPAIIHDPRVQTNIIDAIGSAGELVRIAPVGQAALVEAVGVSLLRHDWLKRAVNLLADSGISYVSYGFENLVVIPVEQFRYPSDPIQKCTGECISYWEVRRDYPFVQVRTWFTETDHLVIGMRNIIYRFRRKLEQIRRPQQKYPPLPTVFDGVDDSVPF